jgi:hypothetical protein
MREEKKGVDHHCQQESLELQALKKLKEIRKGVNCHHQ